MSSEERNPMKRTKIALVIASSVLAAEVAYLAHGWFSMPEGARDLTVAGLRAVWRAW